MLFTIYLYSENIILNEKKSFTVPAVYVLK